MNPSKILKYVKFDFGGWIEGQVCRLLLLVLVLLERVTDGGQSMLSLQVPLCSQIKIVLD